MSFHKALGLVLVGGLFFSACKKPVLEDTLLIPEDNLNVRFTDTLTVEAFNVPEESIDVYDATYCVLGTMKDPDLGRTFASFYLPFRFRSGQDSVILEGTSPLTPDSIILSLWYLNTYGEWRQPQTVEVFEVSEAIDDSAQSSKIFAVYPAALGAVYGFVPHIYPVDTIDGGIISSSLRIRLSNSLAQRFINASGSSDFLNTESFQEFFKGIYITTTTRDGEGLVYFDPFPYPSEGTFHTKLTLYYHDDSAKTYSYEFPAASSSVVNHYSHDFRGSTAEPFITNPADEPDSIIFIQGLAGVNTKIVVPNIRNLGVILVNKAELVITKVNDPTGMDTIFDPPSALALRVIESDGDYHTSPDDTFPSSIYGGVKLDEKDSNGTAYTRYRFSLTRYYQQVISQKREDNGIFILPLARYQVPNRLMAGGSGRSQYALKLNLTYTEVDTLIK